MIECFKLTHGIFESVVSDVIKLHKDVVTHPNRTRGHSLRIYVQKAKKMLRGKAFVYCIVDTWNNLPEEVVSAARKQD